MNPHASISPAAKVAYRGIRLHSGSKLTIGESSIVGGQLVCEREGAQIIIGKRSFIGNSLISCSAKVAIGDDVLISWGCNIVDHNSHALGWSRRKDDVKNWYVGIKDWTNVEMKPVTIGDKAWLGFGVSILKGVEIGEGAIIGAGSVVTREVSPWTIMAGNPAKAIRELSSDER